MKAALLVALAAGVALAGGCAYPTRSRNLADPNVPPVTLAQQVCSNCHRITGNSVSPAFPNLAGQMRAYIVSQLDNFRSHDRQDPAGSEFMWGISRSLSDEQIRGLADYFASQHPAHQPIEGKSERVEAGRTIFERGLPAENVPPCASCHGSEGQGQEAFPRLAGQHVDYLVKQLLVFQRTTQRVESGAMRAVAHDLAKTEMEDVAAYLQALPNRQDRLVSGRPR
ncbi:MAG: c-type cytochrome [Burkholderiaceae bacterium]|nr:c-type cytochrome [Burkholderiaceae bacterium]